MALLQDISSHPTNTSAITAPTSPLSVEINLACRDLHTQLNHSIVKALPYSLPPHAQQPDIYAHGIAVFVGTVYFTFETCWKGVLGSRPPASGEHGKLLQHYLKTMLPEGIERTPRIAKDLRYLGVDPARKPAAGSQEEACKQHIIDAIHAKPHLLIAYAWCMYMAVFAGGRYIRAMLADVGEDFWRKAPGNDSKIFGKQPVLDRPGYSFLSFDADEDGVAAAFRKSFAKADDLLTKDERRDIVQESQIVFQWSMALVKELESLAPHAAPPVNVKFESEKQKMVAPSLVHDSLGDDGVTSTRRPSRWQTGLLVVISLVLLVKFGLMILPGR